MRKMIIGALASLVAMTLSTTVSAQGTEAEAKAMLTKAVAAVKTDQAKAIDMFNKDEGGFLDRDLYVFCSSLPDGKIVALGNQNAKQMIGTNVKALKELDRQDVRRRTIDRRTKAGGSDHHGWSLHVPATGRRQDTSSEVQLRHQGVGRSWLRRRLLQVGS